MRVFCHITVLLFVISMTAGCQRSVEVDTSEPAEPVPLSPTQPLAPGPPLEPEEPLTWKYEEIVELQGDDVAQELSKLIELREYQFEPDSDDGRPEVSLRFFNRHEKDPIVFDVRTLFFREDGSLIDATAWMEASALPRQSYRYRAFSFSKFATKELVQIRNLRLEE